MSIPILECRSLRVRRRLTPVLTDLSFSFDGGILGIMGPNGAGKTSLLRVFAENAPFAGGRAELSGVPLGSRVGADLVRRAVGYQSQRPSCVPHFSVSENLRYASWLKGVSRAEQDRRIPDVIWSMNLERLAGRRAGRLSGGEAKRLAIGMALVHQPRLVILDEPTAALDPEEHDSMLAVIRSVAETTAVVFSSHDPADIAGSCDSVLVVADGEARFSGSLSDLTANRSRTVIEDYRAVMGR